MAHPRGFEPLIPGFVDRCLIQFGHGCWSGLHRGQDYLEERMTSQGVSALSAVGTSQNIAKGRGFELSCRQSNKGMT